jgi:hypothetical protein
MTAINATRPEKGGLALLVIAAAPATCSAGAGCSAPGWSSSWPPPCWARAHRILPAPPGTNRSSCTVAPAETVQERPREPASVLISRDGKTELYHSCKAGSHLSVTSRTTCAVLLTPATGALNRLSRTGRGSGVAPSRRRRG